MILNKSEKNITEELLLSPPFLIC